MNIQRKYLLMSISTDVHIRSIWGTLAGMAVTWALGMWWTSGQYNDLKYDNGVELTKINVTLVQIQCTLTDIKREFRRVSHTPMIYDGTGLPAGKNQDSRNADDAY